MSTNILDWAKVRTFVKERKPVEVDAGILNDWSWTAATIYENGKWVKNHKAYTHSYWATPGFKAVMKNGDVVEVAAHREATAKEIDALKTASERRRKKLHKVTDEIRADNAARATKEAK